MIKILKYGEVENKDIFARGCVKTNVEGIVSEIIENVKQTAIRRFLNTARSLTGQNFRRLP